MKRTTALLAIGTTLVFLVSAPTYAGGHKDEVYYPGGGPIIDATHQIVTRVFGIIQSFIPSAPVIKAPTVSPIGVNQSNAPNSFVCTSKGIKLVRDGSIVKTHYCD
ncbi:hypothetical protein HBO12_00140 [Pseudomonas sp. WS 5059]|jgi:hypothetical protein|uniref:hypothetical protein n=1 Tax=unclassified Pseudomonas TaxID=196821 RepID=UPI001475705E|nr:MULTISPECIES: hypothetical protein [unclassified Pseudomonas]NMX89095.1 hypothetical protein [Pseudomonas sp. WS 5010]NMY01345.1 hypothetical protein [Pseudomonas sp. WS 5059]